MTKLDALTEKVGLPVCVDGDSGRPDDDTVFVVAGNGFFKSVVMDDIRAVFKMEKLPNVPEMKEGLEWLGPKLPLTDLMFLRKMMFDFSDKFDGMELDVHIFHSKTDGFWYGIPWQTVSAASTDWDTDKGYVWIHDFRQFTKPPEDIRKIGNIHSHHSMSPTWSQTDNNLHKTSEFGIQFVIGDKNNGFGVSCRIAMNGFFQDVPLDSIVDMSDIPSFEVPEGIYETPDQRIFKKVQADAKKAQSARKRHRPVNTAQDIDDCDGYDDSPWGAYWNFNGGPGACRTNH